MSNRKPHFFPDNLGLPYRQLSLVRQALADPKFKYIYARDSLA